ncbi:MAG: hypothetical protein LIP01_10515 [Tannerellaceae bacterium]|nr:hypothetical protein [Tannerellaceae bacterium]
MKFFIYEKSNTGLEPTGERCLRISGKNGYVSISKHAGVELGWKKDDRIVFAQDAPNSKNWYVAKADPSNEKAFQLKAPGGVLSLSCRGMVQKILSTIGKNAKGQKFLISKESCKDGELEFHQLFPVPETPKAKK